MSMLSVHVDNLRIMARLVRDYDYREISRALREAADTIDRLREDLEFANNECEIEFLNLQSENAKLRDLVDLMLSCPMDKGDCDKCRQLNDMCAVEVLAGELGIEVSDDG